MRGVMRLPFLTWIFCLFIALPVAAQEEARYVVVLAPSAAGAGEGVVETYGGRIERAVDETTVEAVVSESRATLMARDPRVKSVTRAGAGGSVSTSWTGGVTYTYTYDAAGNVTAIGGDSFIYDDVDRLVSDTVSGRERQHTYDAFGNRTGCYDVSSGGDCQPVSIAGSTNRIVDATYDAAGNLTGYGGTSYAYDGAGMLIQDTRTTTRQYVYTADDERIAMIVGSTWYWTLRDFSGKVLREMKSTAASNGTHSSWQWARDNVWRDGLLLSSRQPSDTSTSTYHYHLDHLGTPRVVSNTNGIIVGMHDYAAFGAEYDTGLKESPESRMKFTGHERDSQGDPTQALDYMHARYYDAMWGRFLSVDPSWESAHLSMPQSWNRYSYVMNNPMKYTDPTGRVFKCETVTNEDGATEQICSEEVDVEAEDPEVEPVPQPSDPSWIANAWGSITREAENVKYLSWRDARFCARTVTFPANPMVSGSCRASPRQPHCSDWTRNYDSGENGTGRRRNHAISVGASWFWRGNIT